jgi:hypothetical protein
VYFQVPKGEQRLVFLVPWTNFNDSIDVKWRRSGTNETFQPVAQSPALASKKRGTHASSSCYSPR